MHGLIEHAIFVKLMHIGAGSMGGAGLASALGGYAYQKCGPYRRVSEAQEGDPDKAAGEEVEKAVEESKEEEEEGDSDAKHEKLWEKEEGEAFDLMKWTICGATLGCLGGVIAGPFVGHYSYHLAWNSALASSGICAAFYSPLFIAVAAAGPESIAKNLPLSIATTVGVGAAISCVAFGFPHGAHAHAALYYLAGCRIAASSFSAVFAALFAQRYAGIQRSKRSSGEHNTAATGCMNWVAINLGQLAGNGVAAMWMYVSLTDWAGAHYPHWFAEVPEVYFLCAVIHLLSPSPDHDQRAETLMARSGLVATHALVFIPEPHAHVAHAVQIIVGQSITALWFGTFIGEWRGTKYIEGQKKLQLDAASHVEPEKGPAEPAEEET